MLFEQIAYLVQKYVPKRPNRSNISAPTRYLTATTWEFNVNEIVLTNYLLFLFWSEIVLDIESPSNFLWWLSFDHVRYCFASYVQQTFDIQVISRLNVEKEQNLQLETCESWKH